MSEAQQNGAVVIDGLEEELGQLVVAEKKKRGEWEKLTGEVRKCEAERVEIAAKKLAVNKQLEAIYKKMANGGKRA